MADETTPDPDADVRGWLEDNPSAVYAHAFVNAKAVWDERVNNIAAAVRHQAADYRARMGLPDDAPVLVTVPELWRSSVALVFADDRRRRRNRPPRGSSQRSTTTAASTASSIGHPSTA